uniref:Uncharacterized protein n=1 Tax=Rhizophora mucronata TaxID=61149 RepID=A0A2P2PB24_RHIMU
MINICISFRSHKFERETQ